MPSFIKTVFLAILVSVFVVPSVSPSSALVAASSSRSLPMPMALMTANDNFSSVNGFSASKAPTARDIKKSKTYHVQPDSMSNQTHPHFVNTYPVHGGAAYARAVVTRQASLSFLDSFGLLQGFYNQSQVHASTLKGLASRSSTIGENDYDFQHACATGLTGFHINLLSFQSTLSSLNANRGLANYDPNNQLETLLKNMINLNKSVLGYTTVLVYNIPVLGSILGPIVYELKCILEDVLDTVESLSDALLNILQPLLQPIIGQASSASCQFGLASLCLL